MGDKGTPLSCLGLNALLQLQDQQVDVSRELKALGRPELIKFVSPPPPSTTSYAVIPEASEPRKHKFNVSSKELRTEDGITFDSKLERAAYVLLREKKVNFEIHPKFILQDKFTDAEGRKYREIAYEGDFLVKGNDGKDYVVDMKGMRTPEFILKEKLFVFKYQRPIHCITTVAKLWEFLIEKKIL